MAANARFDLDGGYITEMMETVKADVDHAGFRVGTEWTSCPVTGKNVSGGILNVTFELTHEDVGTGTVEEIALFKANGDRIGGNLVSLAVSGDALMYSCSVELFQVVVNEDMTGEFDSIGRPGGGTLGDFMLGRDRLGGD